MNHFQYRAQFWKRRRLSRDEPLPGFSIVIVTYNRLAFLRHTVAALLESTVSPFELIIWDNASCDGTESAMRELAEQHSCIRYFRSPKNLGTSGYAPAFLEARHHYLVEVDDDILAIPAGWDERVLEAFQAVPELAYLAMDVVQDEYTNGAKPGPESYRDEVYGEVTLQVGPVGGWFSVTPSRIYDRLGGFLYRPKELFKVEDGDYMKRVRKARLRAGILKGVKVYHASGHEWNAAFGFHDVWQTKYEGNHPDLLQAIHSANADQPLTIELARSALAAARSD